MEHCIIDERTTSNTFVITSLIFIGCDRLKNMQISFKSRILLMLFSEETTESKLNYSGKNIQYFMTFLSVMQYIVYFCIPEVSRKVGRLRIIQVLST